MQTTRIITEKNIDAILDAIYKEGNPIVYQADSNFGKELKEFNLREELMAEILDLLKTHTPFFQFAFYYPESDGHVKIRRIQLNPKKCNGYTFRFSISGWGLIYMQFTKKKNTFECRVVVNTEKRANAWKKIYPEMKEPSLWRWKVVERNAGRIIRTLTKVAQ